jgi:hypothetical protein
MGMNEASMSARKSRKEASFPLADSCLDLHLSTEKRTDGFSESDGERGDDLDGLGQPIDLEPAS